MAGKEALYFNNPAEAVEILSRLLAASDWKTAARYYDLAGAGIEREELESGRYFLYRDSSSAPPFMKAPAVRRPFAPGFKYERHAADGADRVRVYLKLEIDQGGGMLQKSLHAFRLRKSDAGYQALPDEVSYFDQ